MTKSTSVQPNLQDVTVTFQFKQELCVSLEQVDLNDQKTLLAKVRDSFIQQLQSSDKLPAITYIVTQGNELTFETAKVGMPVKLANEEKYGFILAINIKTIKVVLQGRIIVNGHPSAFEKTDRSIDEIMWKRNLELKATFGWCVGDVGYLVNQGEINPVLITYDRNDRYSLHLIDTGRLFTGVSRGALQRLFDEKKEAESYLKSRV